MFKTLSSKGQLVLPAAYRRRIGLRAGSRIRIIEDGERLILEPIGIRRARFVESDGCERPILSVRDGGAILDTELIDPLDDHA
jgi:AbrB family looped-hinge helix DNA binding protein